MKLLKNLSIALAVLFVIAIVLHFVLPTHFSTSYWFLGLFFFVLLCALLLTFSWIYYLLKMRNQFKEKKIIVESAIQEYEAFESFVQRIHQIFQDYSLQLKQYLNHMNEMAKEKLANQDVKLVNENNAQYIHVVEELNNQVEGFSLEKMPEAEPIRQSLLTIGQHMQDIYAKLSDDSEFMEEIEQNPKEIIDFLHVKQFLIQQESQELVTHINQGKKKLIDRIEALRQEIAGNYL